MTPNTFEGYTVHGAFGEGKTGPGFTYGAGYVPKIKERNSDEFIYMSEAAGAKYVEYTLGDCRQDPFTGRSLSNESERVIMNPKTAILGVVMGNPGQIIDIRCLIAILPNHHR